MRRLASIPLPYALTGVLAVGLVVGLYAIVTSGSGTTLSQAGAQASQTATSAAPSTVTRTPTAGDVLRGDAHGAALLAKVRQRYTRVAAVVTTGRLGPMSVRFTSLLRADVVVAESFVGTRNAATTTLVSPPGSPTFARDPGSTCWRLVAASDPQSLTDIGSRFPPYPKGAVVEAPRRTGTGWVIRVTAGAKSSTFAIDAKTLLVRSITAGEAGRQVIEHITTLASAPNLPSPQPSC